MITLGTLQINAGDILLSAVSLVLGVVLGFWLNHRATKPKLRLSQTGGNQRELTIGVSNDPQFLFLRVPRETVRLRDVRLYDIDNRHELTYPFRCLTDEREPELAAGGAAVQIRLFAKASPKSDTYAVANRFNPDGLIDFSTAEEFRDRRKAYEVRLVDTLGRSHRIKVLVRHEREQFSLNSPITLGDRIREVRSAFRQIWWALTARE